VFSTSVHDKWSQLNVLDEEIFMKIGILKADAVLDQFAPAFGQYPAMIEKVISLAVSDGRTDTHRDPDDEPIVCVTYDVEHQEYPQDIAECDAYIITGSKKSVYDDEPWIHRLRDFVVELDETKTPTIGICFGHQMIAEALGGEARAADIGWRVGVHQVQVCAIADYMQTAIADFSLLYSHKDQVTALPTGATLIAGSSQCPNAMYQIGQHMLSVQGHPEFVKDYSRGLLAFRREQIGEDLYNAGVTSLTETTDELLVASWFMRFLRQACAAAR
jgi:GMP synthase-like glutamine amidotransferase